MIQPLGTHIHDTAPKTCYELIVRIPPIITNFPSTYTAQRITTPIPDFLTVNLRSEIAAIPIASSAICQKEKISIDPAMLAMNG